MAPLYTQKLKFTAVLIILIISSSFQIVSSKKCLFAYLYDVIGIEEDNECEHSSIPINSEVCSVLEPKHREDFTAMPSDYYDDKAESLKLKTDPDLSCEKMRKESPSQEVEQGVTTCIWVKIGNILKEILLNFTTRKGDFCENQCQSPPESPPKSTSVKENQCQPVSKKLTSPVTR